MYDLRKVHPGDRFQIPAGAYNAFVDAAKDYQRRQQSQTQSPPTWERNSAIISIRNESGTDVGQFGVLGIGEPIITPADNEGQFRARIAVKGVSPQPEHELNFAIAIEPIATNKIGRAIVAGVTVAKLYVEDEDDTTAGADLGDTDELHTGLGAARILWKESGSGSGKWGLIALAGGAAGGVVDNPHTLSPTYNGTGADTDDWDRSDPPTGTKGLDLTVTTRSVYQASGGIYRLLAFSRTLTFDDRGCLKSVSQETSHTVDTLSTCPEE